MAQLLGSAGLGQLVPAAPAVIGAGTRALVALVFAGVAGGAVWLLFHMMEGGRTSAATDSQDEEPAVELFASRASVQPVPEAPLLRRKDVHPDAPARRPLFAASDLGAPLDEQAEPARRAPIFTDVADPAEAPAELAPAEPEAVAPVEAVEAVEPIEAVEAVEAVELVEKVEKVETVEAIDAAEPFELELDAIVAPEPDMPAEPARSLAGAAELAPGLDETAETTHSHADQIAAAAAVQPEPAPPARPVLQPSAAVEPATDSLSDESLAGLMARLERGLAARGGMPGSLPPAAVDAAGTLRQALEELRSMAAGRR
jgi:hypothetical protein